MCDCVMPLLGQMVCSFVRLLLLISVFFISIRRKTNQTEFHISHSCKLLIHFISWLVHAYRLVVGMLLFLLSYFLRCCCCCSTHIQCNICLSRLIWRQNFVSSYYLCYCRCHRGWCFCNFRLAFHLSNMISTVFCTFSSSSSSSSVSPLTQIQKKRKENSTNKAYTGSCWFFRHSSQYCCSVFRVRVRILIAHVMQAFIADWIQKGVSSCVGFFLSRCAGIVFVPLFWLIRSLAHSFCVYCWYTRHVIHSHTHARAHADMRDVSEIFPNHFLRN